MPDEKTQDSHNKIVHPPKSLQAKVEKGGPGAVDAAALAAAEDVIVALADEYDDWVREDLKKLEKAFDDLKSSNTNEAHIKAVFEIAHDMKGQGGSFGFDLVTAIGDHLCRLLEKIDKVGPRELDMVRVHIDAMQVVVKKRLKGDGGKEGTNLLLGLSVMGKKV